MLMRGISEEEQIAMAIAASLQEQSQTTNNRGEDEENETSETDNANVNAIEEETSNAEHNNMELPNGGQRVAVGQLLDGDEESNSVDSGISSGSLPIGFAADDDDNDDDNDDHHESSSPNEGTSEPIFDPTQPSDASESTSQSSLDTNPETTTEEIAATPEEASEEGQIVTEISIEQPEPTIHDPGASVAVAVDPQEASENAGNTEATSETEISERNQE
jgi:hypothetical protein